jgi:hypothetical protein
MGMPPPERLRTRSASAPPPPVVLPSRRLGNLRRAGLVASALLVLTAAASSYGRGEKRSIGPTHDPSKKLAALSSAGASGAQPLPSSLIPSPDDPSPTNREWKLIWGRSWQISSPAGESTAVTDAREGNRGACLPGQIEVSGNMKQHFLLDELQMQSSCIDWIDKKWPERCGRYDRDKWLAASKDIPTKPMHFCIDRYEYPNRKGEYPIILVSWYEARDQCQSIGKRLCSEDEWTFACEGEEAMPYPNGYVRDHDACLNDRPWMQFDDSAYNPRNGEKAKAELDRLWQGLPSGARPLCKSSFGVYDLTGNVDEWTRSATAQERQSTLKGGYWGPVRTRCRPATKAHDEQHVFYQQGFRCCSDAGG